MYGRSARGNARLVSSSYVHCAINTVSDIDGPGAERMPAKRMTDANKYRVLQCPRLARSSGLSSHDPSILL